VRTRDEQGGVRGAHAATLDVPRRIIYSVVNINVESSARERGGTVSSRSKIDVPGTYVFDAEQSRRGYRLNTMFMSLRDPANRTRFLADEQAYCDSYGLSDEQARAVLRRDWNRMMELGGNIFYLVKLAMTDHRSMQYLGGVFSGMTEEEFVQVMLAGGRTDG
jgi:protocatechuate 4,5-dioxygenase alpha chain